MSLTTILGAIIVTALLGMVILVALGRPVPNEVGYALTFCLGVLVPNGKKGS